MDAILLVLSMLALMQDALQMNAMEPFPWEPLDHK